jgi:hypothetical protein
VHAHRIGIHDLDAVDGAEVGARAQSRRLDTLEAELGRLGVEGLTVVELHALAELDFPCCRRDEFRQLGGERRHDLEILVALD